MTAVIEPAATVEPAGEPEGSGARPGKVSMWRLLWRDKLAVVAAVTLTFITLVAIFGPMLIGDAANDQDLSRGVSDAVHHRRRLDVLPRHRLARAQPDRPADRGRAYDVLGRRAGGADLAGDRLA